MLRAGAVRLGTTRRSQAEPQGGSLTHEPARGETLLSVRALHTWFHTDAGTVKAVDGLSFDLRRSEVLAIVGDSGSGKSATALSIMGLVPGPAGRIESGEVRWKGRNLVGLREQQLRKVRGAEIAMVFQDPMSSLNPVHSVGRQIAEMVRIRRAAEHEARQRAVEMMELSASLRQIAAVTRRDRYRTKMLKGGKRAAEEALAGFVAQCGAGTASEGTFGAFVERWFTVASVSKDWSPKTIDETRRIIDTKLGPLLPVSLDKLRTSVLDTLYADLRARGGRCSHVPPQEQMTPRVVVEK